MSQHAIELELHLPLPRRVRRRGTRGYGTLWSQFLLFPLIAITLVMTVWWAHSLLVRTAGQIVVCEIVDRQRETNSDNDGWVFFLKYRVTIDGQETIQRTLVDETSFANTPVGSKVPLQLSPVRPGWDSLLLIPGRNVWGVVWGTGFASLLMLAGLGAMIWYLVIDPARRRKLVVYGVPVVGRITDKTHYSDSEARANYLHYEYSLPDQSTRIISGKQSVRESDWNKSEVGEACTVLYDPQKPRSSVLYCYGDFEAVR